MVISEADKIAQAAHIAKKRKETAQARRVGGVARTSNGRKIALCMVPELTIELSAQYIRAWNAGHGECHGAEALHGEVRSSEEECQVLHSGGGVNGNGAEAFGRPLSVH